MKNGLLIFLILQIFASNVAKSEEMPIRWIVGFEARPDLYVENGRLASDTGYGKSFLTIANEFGENQLAKGASVARLIELGTSGDSFCVPGMLKTPERNAVFSFSKPRAIALAQQLFMRKGTWAELGKPERLSLKYLLANHPYVLGYGSRSYGEKIDELLASTSVEKAVKFDMDETSYIEFIVANRADLVVGWPVLEYAEFNKKNGFSEKLKNLKDDQQLVSVDLEEMDGLVYLNHVMCTRTEQGEQWLAKVDQAIANTVQQEVYKNMVLDRYSFDFVLRQRAEKAYDRLVLNQMSENSN